MVFDPDKRKHKILTAEYRVDGDYNHAIPAYPEYNSATEFENAFYQERRDENDRLVGLAVAPIEYTDAPPAAEIPDPGLRFTITSGSIGAGTLALSKFDIAIPTTGTDLDGDTIIHHPGIPTSYSGSVTGQLYLVYYDINDVLRSASFDITYRNVTSTNNESFYTFPFGNGPDQEFLDSVKYGTDCWIDSSYP